MANPVDLGALLRLTDVRAAWRALRSRPAYGLIAMVTIALVVGAGSAVLAVISAAGRMFTDAEDKAAAKVAVISSGFARSRMGAAAPLGGRLVIDGEEFEVMGVLPPVSEPEFVGAEVFTPLSIHRGNQPVPSAGGPSEALRERRVHPKDTAFRVAHHERGVARSCRRDDSDGLAGKHEPFRPRHRYLDDLRPGRRGGPRGVARPASLVDRVLRDRSPRLVRPGCCHTRGTFNSASQEELPVFRARAALPYLLMNFDSSKDSQ